MYPAPFRYYRPDSLKDAITLLSELGEGARPLAGGQTLIPILKLRMDEPSDLVDIGRLPDLRYLRHKNGQVHIGALATHASIARSEIASLVPIVGDCAAGIADPQVRSRGTIGGSVSAADPSCDWPSLLHTLDAEILCQGTDGKRTIPIRDFIQDSYTTALADAELVTGIRFNVPQANSGGSYIGFKKAAPAYPAAAVGIQLILAEGELCEDVRLVLSAVGPRPVTSEEAEAQLRGQPLTRENLQKAAEAIIAESDPPSDSRGTGQFKRAMLGSLFAKAAETAIRRARGAQIDGSHNYV
ncbi:MAG: FAD binding domain-containing protein [Gammaproteobacteria bacterium]